MPLDLRDCTDIAPSFQRLQMAAAKYTPPSADNEDAVLHIDSAIYKLAREIHPPELIQQWEQTREKKLRKWMLTTPRALEKMQQALKGTASEVSEKLEQKVNLFIQDFDKQANALQRYNQVTAKALWLEQNACYFKGFSDEGIPLNDSQMQRILDMLKKLKAKTTRCECVEAQSLHLQVKKLIRAFPYEPVEQQSKVSSWFKPLMKVLLIGLTIGLGAKLIVNTNNHSDSLGMVARECQDTLRSSPRLDLYLNDKDHRFPSGFNYDEHIKTVRAFERMNHCIVQLSEKGEKLLSPLLANTVPSRLKYDGTPWSNGIPVSFISSSNSRVWAGGSIAHIPEYFTVENNKWVERV